MAEHLFRTLPFPPNENRDLFTRDYYATAPTGAPNGGDLVGPYQGFVTDAPYPPCSFPARPYSIGGTVEHKTVRAPEYGYVYKPAEPVLENQPYDVTHVEPFQPDPIHLYRSEPYPAPVRLHFEYANVEWYFQEVVGPGIANATAVARARPTWERVEPTPGLYRLLAADEVARGGDQFWEPGGKEWLGLPQSLAKRRPFIRRRAVRLASPGMRWDEVTGAEVPFDRYAAHRELLVAIGLEAGPNLIAPPTQTPARLYTAIDHPDYA